MSLKQTVLSGGIFLFGRQLVAIALKAVGVLFITRVLGPEKYGSYVAAYGIYLNILWIGQVGIGVYILRHPGDVPREAYGTATSMLAGLAFALGILVWGCTPFLDSWINVPGSGAVLAMMILALPLQFLSVAPTAKLERQLRYKQVALSEILGLFTYYGVAIPFMIAGRGPVSLAEAYVVQQLVLAVAAYRFTREWPEFSWDRSIARDICAFATSFSLVNWIWQLRGLVNPVIVGRMLGGEAVGLVGMTIGLLDMISLAKTIAWRLSVVVLGRFQDDPAKLREGVRQGMLLQSLAVGSVILGFGWLGRFLVPLIFGERWASVMDIYPYLGLVYYANAVFNMHSSALAVLKNYRAIAYFHIAYVVTFAFSAYFAVGRFGITGYGSGELVAVLSYWILHAFLSRTVGRPDYRVAVIWFVGVAIGLAWEQLGVWAIAAPFVALATPWSVNELKSFYLSFRPSRASRSSA